MESYEIVDSNDSVDEDRNMLIKTYAEDTIEPILNGLRSEECTD